MNYKQQEEKENKLTEFRDLLIQLRSSVKGIRELSETLGAGFSKSTIQRYIHELYERHLIEEEEYNDICEWLKNNKKTGNSLGGKISQEKYGYKKDELGHFKGGKHNG